MSTFIRTPVVAHGSVLVSFFLDDNFHSQEQSDPGNPPGADHYSEFVLGRVSRQRRGNEFSGHCLYLNCAPLPFTEVDFPPGPSPP